MASPSTTGRQIWHWRPTSGGHNPSSIVDDVRSAVNGVMMRSQCASRKTSSQRALSTSGTGNHFEWSEADRTKSTDLKVGKRSPFYRHWVLTPQRMATWRILAVILNANFEPNGDRLDLINFSIDNLRTAGHVLWMSLIIFQFKIAVHFYGGPIYIRGLIYICICLLLTYRHIFRTFRQRPETWRLCGRFKRVRTAGTRSGTCRHTDANMSPHFVDREPLFIPAAIDNAPDALFQLNRRRDYLLQPTPTDRR